MCLINLFELAGDSIPGMLFPEHGRYACSTLTKKIVHVKYKAFQHTTYMCMCVHIFISIYAVCKRIDNMVC